MKNYKTIWDDLSTTLSEARFFVGYLGEEDEIRSNGQYTADFLCSVLQIQPNDKVLEIGCGIARVGHELAPRCGEWHGSDISGNMIAHARKRTEDVPNIYLHELPEPDLSIFSDGYFDCVYSTIVFMHLDKAEMFNYMREAYRVLAPGGRVYFDTCNIVAPAGWKQFLEIVDAFGPGQRPGHVAQYSTTPEMEKFMSEAGFAEIEVDGTSNDTLVVAIGRKPEQEAFQRPKSALSEEGMTRTKAQAERRRAEAAVARLETDENGFRVTNGKAMLDYEEWLRINGHIAAKNAYIAELESVISKKNSHIAALEKRIRKQDRVMGAVPVRVATRLSKSR